VHDLRLWSLDGSQHVFSVHIVVSSNLDLKTAEQLKGKIKARAKDAWDKPRDY
jgi:Co/Zn/Cd efflux system component